MGRIQLTHNPGKDMVLRPAVVLKRLVGDPMPEWLVATIALIAPALLGAAAGALGLFKEPERAIDHLNRFALYFAFPALVFAGIAGSKGGAPTELGFWLLVPLVLAVSVSLYRLLFRRHAGTLALLTAFGNVAYLGIPIVEQVLGQESTGIASVAVAIHVTLAVSVGPYLLLRWAKAPKSSSKEGSSLAKVAKQPLLWAPVLAFAAKLLPQATLTDVVAIVRPLGKSAAPVALFLLGLFLYVHRSSLRPNGIDVLHSAARLLAVPALTFGAAFIAFQLGWLTLMQAQVVCLLSAMPVAITTFAITRDLGTGNQEMARAIVLTTLVSALTIPASAWLVLAWIPTW